MSRSVIYWASIKPAFPIASKEMANPNSANVSTIVKSLLDSRARDALGYIISSASSGENETDGFFRGGSNSLDAPGVCEAFHTPKNFSKKRAEPCPDPADAPVDLDPGAYSASTTTMPETVVRLRS